MRWIEKCIIDVAKNRMVKQTTGSKEVAGFIVALDENVNVNDVVYIVILSFYCYLWKIQSREKTLCFHL